MKKPNEQFPHIDLGLRLAVGMGGFTWLGFWLSNKYASDGWLYAGIFLGLFYFGYEIWKLIKETNE